MVFKWLSLSVFLVAIGVNALAAENGYHGLRNQSRTIIYKNGKSKEVVDLRYRVDSEAGAVELSNYRLRVAGGDAKFKILKAEVTTDGKKHEILFDEVQISTRPEVNEGLFEMKDVVIPFNQVKIGSDIVVKYQIEREALIDGIFGTQGGIANNVLADEESQVFISDRPLKSMTKDFDDYYKLTEKKNGDRFEIIIEPTEKTRLLEGRQLKLGLYALSTATSWKQLNQMIGQKYEAALQKKLPEAFQAIVDQVKSGTDRKAQLEMVADRLKKKVTYSGNWTTVTGRFYPAGHERVVQRAKGDCKDYATSMAAILRSLGYKAYVALTFRSEGAMDEQFLQKMAKLPNPAIFNHAIVWAEDQNKKIWWIDPTNSMVSADVLSNDLLGNFALVLDQKTDVQFLPNKNRILSETSIDQTIKINPDNSVESSATMELNSTAYNQIGMIEQRNGAESLKKLLAVMINPRAKTTVNFEKQMSPNKVLFKMNFSSMDWAQEKKGKLAFVEVFHPVTYLLMQSSRGPQVEFREEGTIEAKTKILDRQAVDPINQECYGRSPWVDIDRVVDNVGKDILITDRVKIKSRQLSKVSRESDSPRSADALRSLVDTLKECAQNSRIITLLDPSQKTAEEQVLDRLKGPALEDMTEKDVAKLENETNLNLRRYIQKKLMKFYTFEIKENADDPDPYWRRALIKREIGYLRGDEYLTAYLEDALADVNAGMSASGESDNEKLLTARVKILVDLKRYNEAGVDFKVLLEKSAKSFETYYLGYRMNRVQKSLENAEKWLSMAEKFATTEVDKHKFHGQMALLKQDQKKMAEAVAHYEILLQGKLANSWDWHNAATIYCSMQEVDKCIEYEKKAIQLFDFPMARSGLAEAFLLKADQLETATRTPASVSKVEDTILEALKWNPKNIEAHLRIAKMYLERFNKSGLVKDLEKGRSYLEKALAVEPDDRKVNEMLQLYSAATTKTQKK